MRHARDPIGKSKCVLCDNLSNNSHVVDTVAALEGEQKGMHVVNVQASTHDAPLVRRLRRGAMTSST